ncbi:hypothetical protein IJG44_09955 [bacterium]|nr:hypothetical protein [bacterium]
MKKFFVFFCCFAAVIFILSCGSSKKTDDDTDSGEIETDEDSSDTDSNDVTPVNDGDAEPTTEPTTNDDTDTTPEPNDDDEDTTVPDDDTTSELTAEGVYLGIIGFNQNLYIKEIGLLNHSTESSYKTFIDELTADSGTALYFADYTALEKMRDYTIPPKLKNVALVTFTDGLDNASLNDGYNPGNYNSRAEYRDALHDMIVNEKIHEQNVSAYTIGLKGNDVTDQTAFQETLSKLASSDENVFQVSDMEEAMALFKTIAEALYSVFQKADLSVYVPGGYDDGQHLRFTFDDTAAAADSNLYIEATYRRPSGGGRTLEDITYHGFAAGETTISADSSQGVYYRFVFKDLKYEESNAPASDIDVQKIKLWTETSTGNWDKESEFNPESSSTTTEDKNSALIMLVLDCTTSLGEDFPRMQQAGKDFVTTLVNGSTVGETQIADCPAKPENSVWNDEGKNGKFEQTWNGSNWEPEINESTYSETEEGTCHFKCASEEYIYVNGECKTYCSAVFDGENSQIEVTHNALLNLSVEAWTIEAWIKQGEGDVPTNVLHPIVRKGTSTKYPTYLLSGYYKQQSGDGYSMTSYVDYSYEGLLGGSNSSSNRIDQTVTYSNDWTHVAMVKNNDPSHKMLIFVNGILLGSKNFSDTPTALTTNEGALVIGANLNSGKHFKGLIDAIKISNTAKYTEDFTPGKLSADDETVAFWDFNGDVNDSKNGLNGTATNVTYSTDCK